MLIMWKIKELISDIKFFFEISVGCFLESVWETIRNVLYVVLSILYQIGIYSFIISFYFIYQCVMELKEGVAISDMNNLKPALFLFCVPLFVAMLKEIVRPKN